MSDIPQAARDAVRARAHQRCERCAVPAPWGHAHHRRSRRVVDEHTHHPCCLVWLCPACHRWAHANPTWARADGWVVSQWVDDPATVPVRSALGWRHHHHDGTFTDLVPTKQKEQP